MRDKEALKTACDAILIDHDLEPETVNGVLVTHCNQGAIKVANALGCYELDGLMADDQYKVMDANASGLWLKCIGQTAALHAQMGGLAFAAMTSAQLKETHGHIAAIYPAPMQMSPSLGKEVPIVANVGKTNAEEKESGAFPVADGEPDYFCWQG